MGKILDCIRGGSHLDDSDFNEIFLGLHFIRNIFFLEKKSEIIFTEEKTFRMCSEKSVSE